MTSKSQASHSSVENTHKQNSGEDYNLKFSFLDTKSHYYTKQFKEFRTRTFLYPDELDEFTSDRVTILLKEKCMFCQSTLYPKDILKYEIRESDDMFNFYCMCKNQIYPSLRVRIGDHLKYKNEDTIFLNHL